MAIIAQSNLFSWHDVQASSEILRLQRVLEAIPDENLIQTLERERRKRRDDYPLRAVWNCLVAGIVFGHEEIAGLIRELKRNAELRQVCGLDPVRGERAVPPEYVFSRLAAKLIRHKDLVEGIFHALTERVADLLEDFGATQAADSKAIPVFGAKPKDADHGTKAYEGQGENARVMTWFGYKLHLLVDARHELPIAFELTRASEADSPHLMPLVEETRRRHPHLARRARRLAADKAYDDGADKEKLYEKHGIVPLIPPRNLWTRGEAMRPLDGARHDTIYYDARGHLHCKIDPFEPQAQKAFAPMQYMGFEKPRAAHKFRCPAAAFGIECKNRDACKCTPRVRDGNWGRTVRVALDRDRRIFGPVLFDTRTFQQAYNARTSVERVNSRLDNIFGLEHTFLRGRERVGLRVALILSVMQAVAVSWIELGKPENIRRILRAA